jgi:hypothetical protein
VCRQCFPYSAYTFHSSAAAFPFPLVQERKAGDRAKSLHKSQELAGLAQFLGKHLAPRVPGSHFHSLKLLRQSNQHFTWAPRSHLGTAGRSCAGLPDFSWGTAVCPQKPQHRRVWEPQTCQRRTASTFNVTAKHTAKALAR